MPNVVSEATPRRRRRAGGPGLRGPEDWEKSRPKEGPRPIQERLVVIRIPAFCSSKTPIPANMIAIMNRRTPYSLKNCRIGSRRLVALMIAAMIASNTMPRATPAASPESPARVRPSLPSRA